MKIEVSNGEILDKYSILEIKLEEIKDESKRQNVMEEYAHLTPCVVQIHEEANAAGNLEQLEQLYTDLLNVNKTLWNIEDLIRDCEREKRFDQDFIELARSVYYTNDDRAAVKKKINNLTGSTLTEEKSYQEYA